MDPNATWKLLIEAYVRLEWEDVREAAEALLEWLDRGGFPPDVVRDHPVGADWNRTMTRNACWLALRQAMQALAAPHGIPADVPFTLSCFDCDADGPETFEAALEEGWRDIEFVPSGLSSNFLGCCPDHGESNAEN